MKKSTFTLIGYILLTILALIIAIPTFNFSLGDKSIEVRDLDPQDIYQNNIIDQFEFTGSLDFYNYKLATFSADLSKLTEEEAQKKLNAAMLVMDARLQKLDASHYQLSSQFDRKNKIFKVILRYSGQLSNNELAFLGSVGEVAVWVVNPEATVDTSTDKKSEDPLKGTIFENRQRGLLTNDDILSAKVISDSRIFLADYLQTYLPAGSSEQITFNTPNNFGINLRVKQSALYNMASALSTNPYGVAPVLVTIDGQPIGLQASGQTYNVYSLEDNLLLFTLSDDTYAINALIASIISSPVNQTALTLEKVENSTPFFGVNVAQRLMASASIGLVIVAAFSLLVFRRQAKLMISMLIVFPIWTVALLKIFGLVGVTLDLSLVAGLITALIIFLAFILLLSQRLQIGNLNKNELLVIYQYTRDQYRNLVILAIVMAVTMQLYGNAYIINYANGLGFALVAGLIILLTITKSLLNTIYIAAKKTK